MVLIGHRASGIGHRASGIGHRASFLLVNSDNNCYQEFHSLYKNPFSNSSLYFFYINKLNHISLFKAFLRQGIVKTGLCTLFLLVLFTVISIKPVYGLTTQTAQVINGTSPYLTYDNGKTVSSTILPLLSLILPNNQAISVLEDTSTSLTPIVIDKPSPTFADIKTNLPFTSYPSMPLANAIVANNYWRDADGDKLSTVTGYLKAKWEDVEGVDITDNIKSNPNSELDACKSPYKLTLSADDGALLTNYGIPDMSSFKGGSHSYYIIPNVKKTCYLKPHLVFGKGSQPGDIYENGNYAGPPEQWDPDRGFKPQNINDATSNFPTTGSNNFFFIMQLAGLTANEFIAINSNTVNASSGTGISLSLSREGDYAVRITLKGPAIDSPNKSFSVSTFKLYSDQSKTNLIYQFTIWRWYLVKPSTDNTFFDDGQAFCRTLGGNYKLPEVFDLTNANGKDIVSGERLAMGLPGQGNVYQRRISYWNEHWIGGLFNEWGMVNNEYYTGSNWYTGDYVVNHKTTGGLVFNVHSNYGDVDTSWSTTTSARVACITF